MPVWLFPAVATTRVGGEVSAVASNVTNTSLLMLASTVFGPDVVPSRRVVEASPD